MSHEYLKILNGMPKNIWQCKTFVTYICSHTSLNEDVPIPGNTCPEGLHTCTCTGLGFVLNLNICNGICYEDNSIVFMLNSLKNCLQM